MHEVNRLIHHMFKNINRDINAPFDMGKVATVFETGGEPDTTNIVFLN